MTKKSLILAGALLFALAAPLTAQTIGAHPAAERGQRSIALSAGGTSQIGFWMRQSERTDLGLEAGMNGYFGGGNSTLSFTLTPALKRYHSSTGPLAPYSYFGLPLAYGRNASDSPDITTNSYGIGGIAGFGLEWFPVPQISIGGHVGVRASYLTQSGDQNLVNIGTMTSGIRAQLYF